MIAIEDLINQYVKSINQVSNKPPSIMKDEVISKWQHEHQNQILRSAANKIMKKHKHNKKLNVWNNKTIKHSRFS